MRFAAKLLRFLKEKNIKKCQFARQIQVTPAMISRYLNDGVIPSYWTALKIERVTKYYITMKDIGYIHETF